MQSWQGILEQNPQFEVFILILSACDMTRIFGRLVPLIVFNLLSNSKS